MSRIPNIRFKGFTNDWEQRKFSDFTWNAGKRNSQNLDLEPYAVTNDRGFIRQNEAHDEFGYMKDVDRKAYNIVMPNSFAYNPARINVGSIGYYEGTENVIVSSLYEVFQTADYVDDRFLWHWFKSDIFPKWIERLQEGSVRLYFYYDKLCECTMLMPSLPEQKKIAATLDEIDNLITLHQRKCDETKELKQYLLQNMYPQKGLVVPKIRFAGFAGAWEQRKLGDIIDKLTGGASIAPDDYVEEGYRTIPKGAVNDTGIADMSGCKCVSEDFFKKNISSKTSTGELVTSLRDLVPTAPNMGRIVRIYGDSEDFLMPQGVYSIALKSDSDEDFLITYSNSPDYRKIITTEKNGSTQVHIRNGEFLNIDIPVPSYDEQKKIGDCFRNLDNLITLHQRNCDNLKEVKKYMLQNMFLQKG